LPCNADQCGCCKLRSVAMQYVKYGYRWYRNMGIRNGSKLQAERIRRCKS
jgi:hypothetical protein